MRRDRPSLRRARRMSLKTLRADVHSSVDTIKVSLLGKRSGQQIRTAGRHPKGNVRCCLVNFYLHIFEPMKTSARIVGRRLCLCRVVRV